MTPDGAAFLSPGSRSGNIEDFLGPADAAWRHVAGAFGVEDARASPAGVPGAYLLLVDLAAPLPLRIRTLPPTVLTAGGYVYVGSARGPGGIRARVRHHLRRGKRLHWHVDRLSEAAARMWAVAVPGAEECALVRALLAGGAYEVAVAGFGSSDCRSCLGHLLRLTARA